MTRLATTPGLLPLPDWSKTELTSLKGRQKDDLISGDEGPDITSVYDEARTEVLDLQERAGMDRIVEGQLRWDDMLAHPLVVHDAVETGGLVRYYDNNNFYRETIVRGPLDPDGDVGAELTASADEVGSDRLQAVLPGPYSLSELVTDEYFESDEALLAGLGEFLADEIAAFPDVATMFLLDPSLGVDVPDQVGPVIDALETVTSAAADAGIEDVVLHPYWGVPAEAVYAALRAVDGLGLGYDLVTGGEQASSLVEAHGAPETVALGVVDGQNTRLESIGEINEAVSRFTSAAGEVERTYLTTNTELFYLPMNHVGEKLELLSTAATATEVHDER